MMSHDARDRMIDRSLCVLWRSKKACIEYWTDRRNRELIAISEQPQWLPPGWYDAMLRRMTSWVSEQNENRYGSGTHVI